MELEFLANTHNYCSANGNYYTCSQPLDDPKLIAQYLATFTLVPDDSGFKGQVLDTCPPSRLYNGPKRFRNSKGILVRKTNKIIDKSWTSFNPETKTYTINSRYEALFRQYDKNKPCFKTTLRCDILIEI